jgi:hypothetical protein
MRKRLTFGLLGLTALIAVAMLAKPAQAQQSTRLTVYAYVDINADKMMNDGEGIDLIPVYVEVDGQRQAKIADEGKVTFSLPYVNIETIKVEIPYLAMGEEVDPDDELVAVVAFRVKAPELPVYLP